MAEKRPHRLRLHRPLAILDLETTGLRPGDDRIVSIGVLRVQPDGDLREFHSLINPQMKIPKEAVQIHGITDRHVKKEPTFPQVASKIQDFLGSSDLAGFNILGFDLPFLESEFGRTRVRFDTSTRKIIDVMDIFHAWKSGRLTDAYRLYLRRELRDAHTALGDCRACWEILQAQVHSHLITPPTVGGITKFSISIRKNFIDSGRWFKVREGRAVFARGKHRDRGLKAVARDEPTYLDWMLELPDLRVDTRRLVTKALKLP